jgi:hypothetical protein
LSAEQPKTSESNQVKHFDDKQLEELDFKELLETGRILWPTYFQLAAMSFAWNASLAAGFAIIFNGGLGNSEKQYVFEIVPVSTAAMMIIALIGLVYNIGALSAYVLMNNLHRSIIAAVDTLPPRISTTVTARLLLKFIRRDRKQVLKHFTHIFFIILCGAWLSAFILIFRSI